MQRQHQPPTHTDHANRATQLREPTNRPEHGCPTSTAKTNPTTSSGNTAKTAPDIGTQSQQSTAAANRGARTRHPSNDERRAGSPKRGNPPGNDRRRRRDAEGEARRQHGYHTRRLARIRRLPELRMDMAATPALPTCNLPVLRDPDHNATASRHMRSTPAATGKMPIPHSTFGYLGQHATTPQSRSHGSLAKPQNSYTERTMTPRKHSCSYTYSQRSRCEKQHRRTARTGQTAERQQHSQTTTGA